MKFHGDDYSTGILGFLAIHDRRLDRDYLCDLRISPADDAFRVGFLRRDAKGSVTEFAVLATGNFEELNRVIWLQNIGRETTRGKLAINDQTYDVVAHPAGSHPGNVILDGIGDLRIFAIRHDCNPWPAGVVATVAVSAAVVAASVAVTAVAVTGTEVKIEASSDGVSISIGRGDGDGDGEEGDGDDGEGGNGE